MNTIKIECKCPVCERTNYVEVNAEKYNDYIRGELVQKCFPELSADDRELLITGICKECWDNMFK